MTPEMWFKVILSASLYLLLWFILGVIDDWYYRNGGDKNTFSHAWATLACQWQIVTPLVVLATAGFMLSLDFHLFVGRVTR